MKLNAYNSRFMRLQFLILAVFQLILGVTGIFKLKTASWSALLLITLLLICECFILDKGKVIK